MGTASTVVTAIGGLLLPREVALATAAVSALLSAAVLLLAHSMASSVLTAGAASRPPDAPLRQISGLRSFHAKASIVGFALLGASIVLIAGRFYLSEVQVWAALLSMAAGLLAVVGWTLRQWDNITRAQEEMLDVVTTALSAAEAAGWLQTEESVLQLLEQVTRVST